MKSKLRVAGFSWKVEQKLGHSWGIGLLFDDKPLI
jgi:hypothetical protein